MVNIVSSSLNNNVHILDNCQWNPVAPQEIYYLRGKKHEFWVFVQSETQNWLDSKQTNFELLFLIVIKKKGWANCHNLKFCEFPN